MANPHKSQVLNPDRFIVSIKQELDFLNELPKTNYENTPEDEWRENIRRAIAAGAISLANKHEKEKGEYDLDANLYKLVAGLNDFHKGSVIMDQLRDEYSSPHYMPPPQKRDFYDHKENVTEFNHVLREVINAGASNFNFNDLLTFMTTMYIRGNGDKDVESFHSQARMAIIGMRNEVAVEQLLIAAGIEYELGTQAQDSIGGDIVIQHVLIDIKASERSAEKAKQKARRSGRNPNLIVWSHITLEDYKNQLTLPPEKNAEILRRLLPDLEKALESRGEQLVI